WADDRHPHARVFLGTGVLGGFTTYSAFAVHAVTVSTDAPFVGLALIAASLFGGVLAAAVGLGLGVRLAGSSAGTPTPEDAE
ncbi:fluoride efflux transporter FluC, partial [Streptomyces scabiei]|uniref:fluoride efflux transporter FluC n=1 Tax=Streptomyces scabiei TaxID=1930 RepID=UPI0038F817C6